VISTGQCSSLLKFPGDLLADLRGARQERPPFPRTTLGFSPITSSDRQVQSITSLGLFPPSGHRKSSYFGLTLLQQNFATSH